MPSDTQAKYAVQAAAFREAIYVGKLDSAGTAFLEKEDATDMVLAAVAHYVREHFAGALAMDFTSKSGKPGFTLTVTVGEHDSRQDSDPRPKDANISTIEQLGEVPIGTIVRSAAGTIASRFDQDNGVVFGDDRPFSWERLQLPVTILLSADEAKV